MDLLRDVRCYTEMRDEGYEHFVFWHIQSDEAAFSEGSWTMDEAESDEDYLEAISDDLHDELHVFSSDTDTMQRAVKSLRVRLERTNLRVNRDGEDNLIRISREKTS